MDKIKILKINKFKDKRGYFFEILNNKNISKEIKIKNFKQLNLSYSKKNVLRGLHYQIKNSQGKLITVIKGEIFDVMLDLRNNSKTFGKVFSKYVRDKDNNQVWVPKGFAHGFLALSKETIVIYHVSEYFDSKNERTILWNDKSLNIKWPIKTYPYVSQKDKKGSNFNYKKKYFKF